MCSNFSALLLSEPQNPMKTKTLTTTLCLGASLVFAFKSSAADLTNVDEHGGQIHFIDTPTVGSIGIADLESNAVISAWHEGAFTVGPGGLSVYTDKTPNSETVATLAAGTVVRSYLLSWNPVGNLGTTLNKSFTDAFVAFDSEILGFLGTPTELKNSDTLATGDSPFESDLRNHEGRSAGFGSGNDAFLAIGSGKGDNFVGGIPGKTFRVERLAINNNNVDHIRIITAVPEPATVIGSILAIGLVGYQGLRRRKKALAAAAA